MREGRAELNTQSGLMSRLSHHRSFDLRPTIAAAGAFLLGLVLGMASPGAMAQDPVNCDRLQTSLSTEFANTICYRRRFSGETSGWHEHIQGENSRHLITVVVLKATDNRTYLQGTSIERLYRQFEFPSDTALLTDPEKTADGFEFATVGAPSSTHCFLFLREQRPSRGGYRELQYGLACDKTRMSRYATGDVEALLAKISFSE